AATSRIQGDEPARVLVIRDTRESGEMLEAAVAAGIAAAGGEALLGGVLPTPGAPLLVQQHGLDLGVVISASHNPYRDNGVKFFGADGYKLSDATEAAIEAALDQPPAIPEHPGRLRGADLGVIGDEPDGRNINHRCGSTDLARLKAAMQAGDDELGFAFDGDG